MKDKNVTAKTVTFDNDIIEALNAYRAITLNTGKDKSFSEAVNELLREILKKKNFLGEINGK